MLPGADRVAVRRVRAHGALGPRCRRSVSGRVGGGRRCGGHASAAGRRGGVRRRRGPCVAGSRGGAPAAACGREHQHWQRDGGVRHGVLLLWCEAAAACVCGAAWQDGEEIGEGLRPAGARRLLQVPPGAQQGDTQELSFFSLMLLVCGIGMCASQLYHLFLMGIAILFEST